MSDVSRRDVLRNVALAVAAGGMIPAAAQHVHEMAAEEKSTTGGVYKPKAFNDHEYKTISRLCDLIFPPDEHSKGAVDAGAPEFIDLLSSANEEMAAIYTGGVGWLDREMTRRYGKTFVDASSADQTAMLDLIAYRKNETPELGPGIRFFDWIRKMTADAYYTSPIGIADLGYMGNKGMAKFEVPENVLQYALKRSNL
jgi:gluconate 2-dehydrogenase gamma chain